ncbi:epidermal differentiation-specific protein-like [Ascaphus truei]|uniref:epidermal differentiation-specific protein-like n=1 Tax=Ascaphus truei TaxID=8439 RepID=UPI003F5A819A
MSLSAKVQWDKQTQDNDEDVLLEEMVASNNSSVSEDFYAHERGYESSITHSITFPNDSKVPMGSKIELQPKLRLGGNTGPLTLVRGSEESHTEVELVRLKMPGVVPPNSKVTVTVTRRETFSSAPVEISVGGAQRALPICARASRMSK